MQKHWEVTAIWRSGFPSTVYMWTVNIVRASKRPSEMFQTLMEKAYYSWNVFLGAPDILCECWKIWGIFVCLYQETCEQRDSQHLQLTWRERCSSQARTCLCKKNKEIWQGEKMQDPIYQSENFFFFSNNSSHTWHVHSARKSIFPINFRDHMS